MAITLLAVFLRLWHLGTPRVVRVRRDLLRQGRLVAAALRLLRDYIDKANEQILAGQTRGIWKDDPSMIVHPEVGKWLIALGEKAFGMDPFGWRVAAAVVGSLMVLVMCRLARRVTGSTALGIVAGLLMCFDGLQFVLSRLALLDIFLAFFLLCAVHCMVADRDWYRARMARLVPAPVEDAADWGPVRGLLFRPWLLAAGISCGLAIGTKWTAAYALAAFGLLVWFWSAGRAAPSASGGRCSLRGRRRPPGVRVPRPGRVRRVRRHLDRLADPRRQVRGAPLLHAVHEVHRLGHCDGESFVSENPDDDARWPTATEPDASGPAR